MLDATATDISERKRTEETLLLFRALIDCSNDGIEVIDPETGRFLDVNETACLTHGYTRDEYLALSVRDVAPTSDPSTWAQNLEQLRRLGSRLHVGLHRRKDGSTFPVEVNITYVRMPRISGPQLAGRLAPARPDLRVLFMSGYAGAAITASGMLESDSVFLQKPFSPVRLARKVREVLDTEPAGRW